MLLIAGLGNVGQKYTKTRHNVGFMALDLFALKHGFPIDKTGFKSTYCIQRLPEGKAAFIKPSTFMNLSGQSVVPFANYYGILPSSALIIHDDTDFELGEVKIRKSGSPGRHNGMSSIITDFRTQDVPRVRIGIGRPPKGMALSDFVLSPFSPKELEALSSALDLACEAISLTILEGVDRAMNQVNTKKKDKDKDG
ncbi:MAG: aminoacyl-tRNA hydrolase [Eubacteriaceae bacterium]|nr:aminoacyl-tRNA hydrolase [Eubacteriaceae bacterium]